MRTNCQSIWLPKKQEAFCYEEKIWYGSDRKESGVYEKAVDKYGTLNYDECFGYVPILALGGKESVNNLKKVKIREHIALITELAGGI